MDTAKVEKLIVTTNARRGDGVPGDPCRVITQIWTTDGELVAELDSEIDRYRSFLENPQNRKHLDELIKKLS